MTNEELLDLVIIGAAAAGPAAAVYASRRHLNFVVVTTDIGGEVALAGEVENWPGTIKTTGIELSKSFEAHMKKYDPKIDMGYAVTKIEQDENIHVVHAKNFAGEEKVYRTKAVIVSTGIHPRKLGLPGEEEFKGRGVTYCTVCDGPLFAGKTTATIGAGNSALESALMMGEIADKVYLLTKYEDSPETNGGFPRGENILIEKAKNHNNIEIIYNALTTEITGDGMVGGLTYKDATTDEEKSVAVNGIMVHIGVIPNSNFVDCVEKDAGGQIKVNTRCETNCPGIFAAGDVTDNPFNQIAIAAGMGVTAALAAIEYLNKWKA